MNKIEKTKRTDGQKEDWAIFPFSEAEDDARWVRLSEEMDELWKKTVSTEQLTGTILMKDDLHRFAASESESHQAAEEDPLF